jgi:hydrogenase maturation protein HypF
MELYTYKITIKGVVQGVGFRPFIYNLAKSFSLNGYVYNGNFGVAIVLNATQDEVETFITDIKKEQPPLASIESIEYTQVKQESFDDFTIKESVSSEVGFTNIPPDLFVCEDCARELLDPNDRRYGYPFITCTNCGVRYSIIKNLPYDRVNTSMAKFTMCKACEAEYSDPSNRRYHAQPIGCYDCGPSLSFLDNNQAQLSSGNREPIALSIEALKQGAIVAIKGVGGYHLVCDATNDTAVQKLRERKHRPSKPFALMLKDIESARELAYIDEQEAQLLSSPQRAIVLLDKKGDANLSKSVAPHLSRLGIFLAYTPLHLLLLDALDVPLVATSANISDDPIATNIEELRLMSGVYDFILDHNREIVNRCDDSVVMVVEKRVVMIRRARGYAPASLKLPYPLKQSALAVGAHQKNSVAIGSEESVVLSPYIGDLGNIASIKSFERAIKDLQRVYSFNYTTILHDAHKGYDSTHYALAQDAHKKEVYHHYAHILSVMAEHGLKNQKVLGVAFDGTGFGEDATLWGGEFLVCDYEGFQRVAHLKPFLLLGGEAAIKEPRRVALALLFDIYGKEALKIESSTLSSFSKEELTTLYTMWERGLNAPKTSSMGRVFDAVASLLGISQTISFEGESGMLLEEFYDETMSGVYDYDVSRGIIDISPMIISLTKESDTKIAVTKFFNTVVKIIVNIYGDYKDLPLCASGGVFQNRILVKLLLKEFPDLFMNEQFPPNDGGIALGQMASFMNIPKGS